MMRRFGLLVICFLSLVATAQLASSATTRNSLREFDPIDFGAVPDNSASATVNVTAFQAAIDAANAAGRGTVWVGPGDWYVNAAVLLKNEVHVKGAGRFETRIISTTTNTAVLSASGTGARTNIFVSDLTVDRCVPAAFVVTCNCLPTSLCTGNLPVSGAWGIRISSTDNHSFLSGLENVYILHQFNGLEIGPMGGGTVSDVTIQQSWNDGATV